MPALVGRTQASFIFISHSEWVVVVRVEEVSDLWQPITNDIKSSRVNRFLEGLTKPNIMNKEWLFGGII
jgi:hypothetical protein